MAALGSLAHQGERVAAHEATLEVAGWVANHLDAPLVLHRQDLPTTSMLMSLVEEVEPNDSREVADRKLEEAVVKIAAAEEARPSLVLLEQE